MRGTLRLEGWGHWIYCYSLSVLAICLILNICCLISFYLVILYCCFGCLVFLGMAMHMSIAQWLNWTSLICIVFFMSALATVQRRFVEQLVLFVHSVQRDNCTTVMFGWVLLSSSGIVVKYSSQCASQGSDLHSHCPRCLVHPRMLLCLIFLCIFTLWVCVWLNTSPECRTRRRLNKKCLNMLCTRWPKDGTDDNASVRLLSVVLTAFP